MLLLLMILSSFFSHVLMAACLVRAGLLSAFSFGGVLSYLGSLRLDLSGTGEGSVDLTHVCVWMGLEVGSWCSFCSWRKSVSWRVAEIAQSRINRSERFSGFVQGIGRWTHGVVDGADVAVVG